MRTTSTLPIVMAYGTEPVASGFVASLARPGGNIRGLMGESRQATEDAAKRLGVTLRSHQARRPENLDTACSSIGKEASSIHSPT